LLVDDNAQVRAVVQRLLEELGYRVTSTNGARAALDLLAEGLRPDLLLTDVVLPRGLNGFELAAEARRLVPELRLLYASGYAQELANKRPEASPDAILLAKPFLRHELAKSVRQALDVVRGA